jgi:hypothetical protein
MYLCYKLTVYLFQTSLHYWFLLSLHRNEWLVLRHCLLEHLLLLLSHHISRLLLLVEHAVRLDVAHIAHVAGLSEREVVVEAPLAGPVTNSLLAGVQMLPVVL